MNKFNYIYNLSIKSKLVAIILMVTFLILSVGFSVVAVWDLKRLNNDISSGLVLNATLIGNYCVAPLTFGDDQQATEVLSRFKYITSVEAVCLYDTHGRLFATYPDALAETSVLHLGHDDKMVFKKGYFMLEKEIIFQEEVVGVLCLKANSNQLINARRTFAVVTVTIVLFLIVLAFFVASRLQRFISELQVSH